MAISLSQKVSPSFKTPQRLLLSVGITDEIYALAMSQKEAVTPLYFLGLTALPYIGWSLGTFCGAIAGQVLPAALGVALYGMFIAIVIPQMKLHKPTCVAVAIAIALSLAFRYIPILQGVSAGFSIILCALIASLFCARFFPVKQGNLP